MKDISVKLHSRLRCAAFQAHTLSKCLSPKASAVTEPANGRKESLRSITGHISLENHSPHIETLSAESANPLSILSRRTMVEILAGRAAKLPEKQTLGLFPARDQAPLGHDTSDSASFH